MVIIRDATDADMEAITALYNHYLETATAAWSEQPQTVEVRREWFTRQRDADHPVLVADDGGSLVGYAHYGSFRGAGMWPGYVHTVEHTIYVAPDRQAGGVGRALLEALVDRARAAEIHVMVGGIDAENQASIVFHERMGFTEVARMPEVGRKWGRWLDLVLMQRILD